MTRVITLVLGLLLSQALVAEEARPPEAKPSDDSLKQLFVAMQSNRIVDGYIAQIEGTVRQSMQMALAGQPVNDKQQKIMSDLQKNIVTATREEISWPRVEPLMLAAYREAFTQHEVDGMLAFYRSEAGRAFVTKIPLATQKTMESMQGLVKTLTPRIVQLEKDSAIQLKAAADAATPAAAPTVRTPTPASPASKAPAADKKQP
jgi:hypothetical protein